jgi:hypothetical protein
MACLAMEKQAEMRAWLAMIAAAVAKTSLRSGRCTYTHSSSCKDSKTSTGTHMGQNSLVGILLQYTLHVEQNAYHLLQPLMRGT